MRRRAAAKVQTNFIDIAPSPPFRRIVAFDDGMAGLAKMLGGVTVWRAVAAADMAARPAEAQMHPRRTKFQTFLASERARVTLRMALACAHSLGIKLSRSQQQAWQRYRSGPDRHEAPTPPARPLRRRRRRA